MFKNFVNSILNQSRFYSTKNKLSIKWIPPVKLTCAKSKQSGETDPYKPVLESTPAFIFSGTEGIKTADDNVKFLCSVGYQGCEEAKYLFRKEQMNKVKRHKYDSSSPEAQIANMTGRIRILQERLDKHPYDYVSMMICKSMTDRRRKLLKYMRKWDYKRYEWLLEKLGLIFKGTPEDRDNPTRRQCMMRLTDLHCDTVKKKKMAEYREQLMKQREELLKEYGIDANERLLYTPEWCPSDTKTQMAEIDPVPDPSTEKETKSNVI